MAVSEVVARFPVGVAGKVVHQAAPVSDWMTAISDVTVSDGAPLVNPLAVSRPAVTLFDVAGMATFVDLRLRYQTAPNPAPVVQFWGFDGEFVPQQLVDVLNDAALTSELPVDGTNDAGDGTNRYGQIVRVELWGNRYFMATVRTAPTGGSGMLVQARFF